MFCLDLGQGCDIRFGMRRSHLSPLGITCGIVVVGLACCSIGWPQETLSERESVLAAFTRVYGQSVDEKKPAFAITTDYVLAPVFSADDLLIEISIEPKSDTKGQDPQHPAHLSQSGFQSLLAIINSIKPLGGIEEDFPAKIGHGGRAWGTHRYQNGYLQTAELIGHAPALPIAFAYIYYLHPVTGIAKIPRDSKPDEWTSFGLVCIGGESYIAPKAEFLKLWAKPNERQTVELAGPTGDDCGHWP